MAIDNFIPQIWAGALLQSLKRRAVYTQSPIVNRDYEGEITGRGDTVKITSIGAVTVSDYTKYTDISWQELTDSQQNLLIDQAKSFSYELDDVDKAQAQSEGSVMMAAQGEAGFALGDVADGFLAGLYTGVLAANNLGTSAVTNADEAYDALLALKVALDDADVPDEGRYCVVPPWFEARLLKSPLFVDASSYGSNAPILNGEIGRIAGFAILKSNNTPTPVADNNIIQAGYPGALTFAEQIVQIEAVRRENRFSDGIKGLHVYGGRLIRPEGIAILQASKA